MLTLLKWSREGLKTKRQKGMNQEHKKEYSEKDYWEGRIPDELFDEYLEKYGYEYTPSV